MRVISRALRVLTRAERWRVVFLAFLKMMVALIDVATLLMVAALTSLATRSDSEFQFEALRGLPPQLAGNKPNVLTACILATLIVRSLATAYLNRISALYLATVELRLSAKSFDFAFWNSAGGESKKVSETVWTLIPSSHYGSSAVLYAAISISSETFSAVLTVISVLVISPASGVFLVAVLMFSLALLQMAINPRLRQQGVKIAALSQKLTDEIVGLAAIQREVRALGFLQEVKGHFEPSRGQLAREMNLQKWFAGLPRNVLEVVQAFAIFLMLLAVQISPDFEISLTELAVALVGGFRLVTALVPIQSGLNELKRLSPQADHALSTLERIRDASSLSVTKNVSASHSSSEGRSPKQALQAPAIDINDLWLPNWTREPLRDGISLRIEPRQKLIVSGPSGAGKSTFLDYLAGFRQITHGRIAISGLSPEDYRNSRVRSLGYSPQHSRLLPASLYDNITFFLPQTKDARFRVEQVLDQVDLLGWSRSLENGLDAILRPDSSEISGGQLSRLSLARLLFHRPGFALLDEPTSALDPQLEEIIIEVIWSQLRDSTVIIATHSTRLVGAGNLNLNLGFNGVAPK